MTGLLTKCKKCEQTIVTQYDSCPWCEIATLRAENAELKIQWKEAEEANMRDAYQSMRGAVDRMNRLEAENTRLQEKLDRMVGAAEEVMKGMRGSGGINPRGAQALITLQTLLDSGRGSDG